MIAALRAARLGWHGLDRRLAARASRGGRLTVFLHELFWFGVKQAWACLFGGLMLALLIATWMFWPADAPLGRYDFVTLMAVAIQIVLLASGLETRREALVIVLFHVTGTLMELFKTATGSWVYPGASILHIGAVPLFTGFMYASVGSYIARAWRLFEFRFTRHPRWNHTTLLAAAIYLNFFTDHYGIDFRWLLFVAVAWLRTLLGALPGASQVSPHAVAARLHAGCVVHLVRREPRHLHACVDVSRAAPRVARRATGKDRLVAAADDHQLRDGVGAVPARYAAADFLVALLTPPVAQRSLSSEAMPCAL